jgi:hypothetical protein
MHVNQMEIGLCRVALASGLSVGIYGNRSKQQKKTKNRIAK